MTKKSSKRKQLFPSPTNVKFRKLMTSLQQFANKHDDLLLEIREAKGSHTVVKFILHKDKWRIVVPRPHGGNNHVLPTYIKKINKIIWDIEDKLALIEGENNDTDT